MLAYRNGTMLLTAVTCLFVATVSAQAKERPNIIILLCDDLGYGDLSCYSHPVIRTPNLDKLAAEGMKLTHCYAAAPVCSPSRAGLLTGRIPQRLGIRDWIPLRSGIFLRPGEVTLAQILKKAGYRTCHAGKWHVNSKTDGSEPTPGDAGFDYWLYTQNNAAPNHLNPSNFIRNGKSVGKLEGPSAHLVVADAIRFLEQGGDQPFFLNLWFHEPHEPVAAAEKFLRQYEQTEDLDRRHYYGDVTQMDAAIGKLVKYLDQHQLRQSTFIFFSSDNGPETLHRYRGANRSYGSPGPLRGMKLHITEAGYRVPGILCWPGVIPAGSVSAEPLSHLDVLPTLCAIAGAQLPSRPLDGGDFRPIFQGKPVERPHALYWHYDYALSRPWVFSLREGPWKLLANAGMDRFALFNLEQDIGEKTDLAPQQPDRVRRMKAELSRIHQDVQRDGAASGNPPARQGRN